jgi:hypothetical protein
MEGQLVRRLATHTTPAPLMPDTDPELRRLDRLPPEDLVTHFSCKKKPFGGKFRNTACLND